MMLWVWKWEEADYKSKFQVWKLPSIGVPGHNNYILMLADETH